MVFLKEKKIVRKKLIVLYVKSNSQPYIDSQHVGAIPMVYPA